MHSKGKKNCVYIEMNCVHLKPKKKLYIFKKRKFVSYLKIRKKNCEQLKKKKKFFCIKKKKVWTVLKREEKFCAD